MLIIHPNDNTTDFLSSIYEDILNCEIIRENISNSKLRKLLITHNEIILLGHGSEEGLFGHNKLVINSDYVQFLRNKKLICIWCNVDKFVVKYKLSGIFTGIIISDNIEANMFTINCNEQDILESNILFAETIKRILMNNLSISECKDFYNKNNNNVINFNRERIYSI